MDDKKIGNFIRKLREEKELTQEEMALELHIHRTLLTKLETGKASLTSDNLIEICNYFDISTDELLLGRKNDNNRKNNRINDVTLKMYEESLREKKKTKRLLISIVIIILIFILYFFLTFYYSFVMYDLQVSSNYISVDYGVLIKSNDMMHMRLDYSLNNEEVKTVKVFYEENNAKFYLNNYTNHIELNNYNYSDDVNILIDNLYLEIIMNDGVQKAVKVSFYESYSNGNFIYKMIGKLKSILGNKKDYTRSEIYYDISNIINNIDNIKSDKYKITYNNKVLHIEIDDNKYYEYFRSDKEYLDYYVDDREIYSYNLSKKECLNGDCKNIKEDIENLKNIIRELSESGM